MNELFRRNLVVSASVHGALLLAILIVPAILNWRVRHKKPEMITYVDLAMVAPEPPGPAPVQEVKPPAPEPPADIPEPPKKKKIEISKKKVKKADEPKPKPQLTPEEIKKLLDMGAKPSRGASTASLEGIPAWYYALVRQTMYDAWSQPSAAAGLLARVVIRVERSGAITRRTMAQASGNKIMDDSVMQAVNSVSSLKPLPPQFTGSYKDITIDFELARGAF